MKKTRRDFIKIALTIAIIAGLFMPYAFDETPFDYIFMNWDWKWEFLFVLPIPLLVVIPLLMYLIFKNSLKDSIVKVLNAIFSILYITTLVDYGSEIHLTHDSIFDFSPAIIIAVIVSLILLLLNLKYSISSPNKLQNMFLAIMGFPIVFYFIIGSSDLNYGGYIMTISFFTLYIMAVIDIFKNRNIKNELKNKEIITT